MRVFFQHSYTTLKFIYDIGFWLGDRLFDLFIHLKNKRLNLKNKVVEMQQSLPTYNAIHA